MLWVFVKNVNICSQCLIHWILVLSTYCSMSFLLLCLEGILHYKNIYNFQWNLYKSGHTDWPGQNTRQSLHIEWFQPIEIQDYSYRSNFQECSNKSDHTDWLCIRQYLKPSDFLFIIHKWTGTLNKSIIYYELWLYAERCHALIYQ